MVSDDILDVIETFIDTNPNLENKSITVGKRCTGETPTVRLLEIQVDNNKYLVMCKQVGK